MKATRQLPFHRPARVLLFRCRHLPFLIALAGTPSAGAATRTWIHGGSDALWGTGANWAGGLIPQSGDALIFSAVTTPGSVSNNLPASLPLSRIDFTTQGYLLAGNSIGLGADGLTLNYPTGTARLSLGVSLTADQTWIAGTAAGQTPELRVQAPVTLNGRHLTLQNRGLTVWSGGTLSGTATGTLDFHGPGDVSIPSGTLAADWIIQGGTVDMRGTHTTGRCTLVGAVLGGDGTVNALTAGTGGIVQPRLASTTETLSITGDADFRSGSTLRLFISAGSADDSISVSGRVRLTGGALDLQITPIDYAAGTTFTLISNTGSLPVEGSFAGLPEGSTFDSGNRLYRLSYRGGDGNDVTITVVTGSVRNFSAGALINREDWTKNNNWTEDSPPPARSNLIFGPILGSPPSAAINDFPAGTVFGMLRMDSANYPLTGSALELEHGIECARVHGLSAVQNTVSFSRIDLAQNCRFLVHQGASLDVTSQVDLNGLTLTLAPDGTGALELVNPLNGSGLLVKSGSGTAVLSGNSTALTAGVNVVEGKLNIRNRNALGTAGTATVVSTDATLSVAVGRTAQGTVPETLALAGVLSAEGPVGDTVEMTGPVAISNGAEARTPLCPLVFSGPLSGTGALRIGGSADVTFSGTQPNTFTGGLLWDGGGVLTLRKTSGVTALPESFSVGGRSFVRVSANEQIADDAVVTLNDGTLELRRSSVETVAGLTFAAEGGSVLSVDPLGGSGPGMLVIDGPVQAAHGFVTAALQLKHSGGLKSRDWTVTGGPIFNDLTVRGPVSADGNVSMRKLGAGRLILEGGLSTPGLTLLQGAVHVEGTNSATAVVVSGGELTSRGALERINALAGAGFISPASSTTAVHTAALLSMGNLNAAAGVTLEFDLNGTQRGTQYDALDTSSGVTLGNASLSVARGFSPAPGTNFIIIQNGSSSPVSGTFAGLPEGSVLSAAGQLFLISYAGGDGNDVVLTAVAVDPSPSVQSISFGPPGQNGSSTVTLIGKGAPGLSYRMETSTDMVQWLPDGAAQTAAAGTGALSFQSATVPGNEPRKFWRIRRL